MLLFFDTETTGVSTYKDHLVQLGWVLCDSGGIVKKRCSRLIKPNGFSIPTAASRIHRITTEYAELNGLTLISVLREFAADAAQADRIIAHNLQFDFGIMQTSFRDAGLEFPLDDKSQICTMRAATEWCRLPKLDGRSGFKYPKLAELHYRIFGAGFDGEHDALQDSLACMGCYFELVKLGVVKTNAEFTKVGPKAVSLKQKRVNPAEGSPAISNNWAAEEKTRADRIKRETEKRRIEAKAKSEADYQAAENKIRNAYETRLSALSDPGNFFLWWICSAVVIGILIGDYTRHMSDVRVFIESFFLGWFPAFLARQLYSESLRKKFEYGACLRERDNKVLAVREMLSKVQTETSTAKVSSVATAQPERESELSEVLAKWLFDVESGELFEIESTMLFDKKYYQRKNDGFQVLMFKLAEYRTVHFLKNNNPSGLNPRLEDTSKTLASYYRSKQLLVEKATTVEAAQAQKKNEKFIALFELEHVSDTSTKHTITAEQKATVERYVEKKNAKEVTKITAINEKHTTPQIDTSLTEETQQKVLSGTKTMTPISGEAIQWLAKNMTFLQSYIEGFGADLIELVAKQCTKAQSQLFWLPSGSVKLLTLKHSDQKADRENFGDDLINCVFEVAQKYFDDHKNHQFIKSLMRVNIEVDAIDIDKFGEKLTETVTRIVDFVFAQNILKENRKTSHLDQTESCVKVNPGTKGQLRVDPVKIPFANGSQVQHRLKGEIFGGGRIVARNGEYLVVEFSAVSRKLEIAVATAGNYLQEID